MKAWSSLKRTIEKCFVFVINPLSSFPLDFVEGIVAFLPRHSGFYAVIKRFLLNIAGAKIGKCVHIYPGVRIYVPKGLIIGNNVSISSYVVITTAGKVTIGDNVLIGYGAKILSANHRIPGGLGTIYGAGHVCKPVVIEDDVWIGANVIVLPGVTLGKGCVVAAGSVVSRNIAPYSIVGGIPAVYIRRRT